MEMIKETKLLEELISIRRHLHQNPEVGMALSITKNFVWQNWLNMAMNQKPAEKWASLVRSVKERTFFITGGYGCATINGRHGLIFPVKKWRDACLRTRHAYNDALRCCENIEGARNGVEGDSKITFSTRGGDPSRCKGLFRGWLIRQS